MFRKRKLTIIKNRLIQLGFKASFVKNECFDLRIEIKAKVFLCKVLFMNKNKELVITNRTTWISHQRNTLVKITDKVKDIEAFLSLQGEKMVLIFPACRNILKFINENEMIIISSGMSVSQVKIIKYNELDMFTSIE